VTEEKRPEAEPSPTPAGSDLPIDPDVRVSDDRRSATITLPQARFGEVRVDPKRSYVYDRRRGLIDRVGDALGDDANNDRDLYIVSEQKLRLAAADNSGILRRGQENTRAMLQGLLGALGFTTVNVRFEAPPP